MDESIDYLMNIYQSEIHNPYYNLATEEHFLKNSPEDYFMLYTNEATVVVGKHQNLLSEINSVYINQNKIKVARRISGGGTVYHDPGNINFSLIQSVEGGEKINYQRFARPVLESLRLLGLNVHFSDRNDLFINGLKISGSAMHVYKNRVLAHGTLLFEADKNELSEALKSNSIKYIDKAIKSVRSKVMNIKELLPDMSTLEMIAHLASTVKFDDGQMNRVVLTKEDEITINKLVEERYLKYDWIYGYSPKYRFETNVTVADQTIPVLLFVEKGIIQNVQMGDNQELNDDLQELGHLLAGKNHQIGSILADQPLMNHISQMVDYSAERFCRDFF